MNRAQLERMTKDQLIDLIMPPTNNPIYWMVGYEGWGSIQDDVVFITTYNNPTAQDAVDEFQSEIDKGNLDPHHWAFGDSSRVLVYRVDHEQVFEQKVGWKPKERKT